MPNPENLTPHNLKNKSKKERKEIATMGAIATNKIIKEKKTLKQSIEIALEYMKKNKLEELNDDRMKEFLSNTDVLTFFKCEIVKNTVDENMKMKAIDSLEDRLHGKPKSEVSTVLDAEISIKWMEE